jgi:hypothetical protein
MAPMPPTLAITPDEVLLVLGVILAGGLIVACNVIGPVLALYIQSLVSGAHVTIFQLLRMKYGKEPVRDIVLNLIRLRIAKIEDVRLDEVRSHAAAGGDVWQVATAMIAASGAKLSTTWGRVAAADLAEMQDVLAAPSPRSHRTAFRDHRLSWCGPIACPSDLYGTRVPQRQGVPSSGFWHPHPGGAPRSKLQVSVRPRHLW